MFPPFKGGGGRKKFYPVFSGGRAQTVLDMRFSHVVAPLPVINDQSLRCSCGWCRQRWLVNIGHIHLRTEAAQTMRAESFPRPTFRAQHREGLLSYISRVPGPRYRFNKWGRPNAVIHQFFYKFLSKVNKSVDMGDTCDSSVRN